MRKKLLILTVLSVAICSCQKISLQEHKLLVDNNGGRNSVSISDVHNILEREIPKTKSSEPLTYRIQPYIGKDADTLFFIVNFENNSGWKIYSSDKRTPAVIAEGKNGYFSLDEGSPATALWMANVAKDIARIHKAADSELTFSEEDIRINKSFWSEEPSRIIDPHLPVYPLGHWEEIISSETVEYDHVDHLVAHWDQDEPYNECCPYYVSTPTTRAAAGCVAIAGAQVLLYLHNKLGVPESMYSEGYCIGNVNYYEKHFANLSSEVWSLMSTEYRASSNSTLPESILISHVGARVGMHYCDDNLLGQFSWAIPRNLQTDLFGYYGISCSHGDYDEEIVKNSLLNQMPVIVSASNQLIPVDGNIHCFVIDGYRRTQTKATHYFHYVLDGPPPTVPYLVPEEYETYTYSQPQLTSIKINWGWRSQWWENNPLNDGWYALTAGWVVSNGDTYSYDHYVKMIYGFEIEE